MQPIFRKGLAAAVKKYLPSSSFTSPRASASTVDLTSGRYNIQRGPYSEVRNEDIQFFKETVPERVVIGEDELYGFNTDWLKTCRGSSTVLLKPKTTQEVSSILKYCNDRGLAVSPQGGNTGLVGGSVPVFDEVILSTQLMNQIISLDEFSGTLVCQAGCILENLDNHLADHGLMMPLDLGAKGSCHIGGNVSTNAGGLRLLRYGSLHGSVLGIEAVLANGDIIDCLSTLRKDNTGYDLKQVFIGSEGTLGFVTGVSVLCPRCPNAINVAFMGCKDFQQALQTFRLCQGQLAEILSAFEFMDAEAMRVAVDTLNLTNPIATCPIYVLVETSGSNGKHDEEKIQAFLDRVIQEGIVLDGIQAMNETQKKNIWALRERLAEGLMHDGYTYKYDISLPVSMLYELVEVMRDRLADKATRAVGYGHLGDGNLHFNATSPEYDPSVLGLIEPFIYDWTSSRRGSISAEHGLGFKKKNFIYHSKSKSAVDLMKKLKSLMDPNCTLNPYKVLPDW